MINKFKLIFIISMVMLTATARAQSKFWDKVTIRKAFETKTADDTKPAIISYTAPKDTLTSYLINGGIGIDLFHLGKSQNNSNAVTGFFVYNHNTLIEKKQKNYKLGVSAGHVIDLNDKPTSAIFGSSTIQYMNNYIDTAHSLILTSYWHPMYKSPRFIPIGGYRSTPHLVGMFIMPEIGLEYQNIVTANSKLTKGYDVRAYFRAGLNLKIKKSTSYTTEELKADMTDSLAADPVWSKKTAKEVKDFVDQSVPEGTTRPMPKDFWTKLLEFNIAYTGRASFANNNSNFEKYIPLFTAGVNLYPLQNENFSFGITYNNGANPIDGTPKQNFWVFALSFKK